MRDSTTNSIRLTLLKVVSHFFNSMLILSIDVGIKNLAMCLMDSGTKKIHEWEVAGVPPQSADGLFRSLKKHVDARDWVRLSPDTVLIEKQPDKNRTIKSVEHFLHTYFLCQGKDVIIWDARHKIPDVAGPGRAKYLERKKASIDRCRTFIEATNPEWVHDFDKHKKKDDLADTCMQALSYIDRQPSASEAPVADKKARPRKPTENQKATKYSKANLAWLYANGQHKNKRFEKDLARYYHNLGELISEFCLATQ